MGLDNGTYLITKECILFLQKSISLTSYLSPLTSYL